MPFGIVTLPNAGLSPVLTGGTGCLASVTLRLPWNLRDQARFGEVRVKRTPSWETLAPGMVVRVFRVLEPLPRYAVRGAMTKPPPYRSNCPKAPPALPPRLKELARQLAEALQKARSQKAQKP